jgi:very-short-patch-repair endonuclease
VLDFYCDRARLAVEIDGSVHDEHASADEERQAYFEAHGLTFVRLQAQLVEGDLDSALQPIREALARPHPSPAPAGEGSPAEPEGVRP